MVGTSARLLRLLTLLQSRRFWPGAALAERLEITERTLRRDVERLRSLGYPIHGQSGVAGGYALEAGAQLPPLSLADDEALAVAIALRTATNALSASIGEAALRALSKLERVFPLELRQRANALRASVLLLERRGPSIDVALLSTLAHACDERRELFFGYAGRGGERSAREVEPAGLVHTGRWYLVAFDRDRQDWRTFRVDRIAEAPRLGKRYTPRPPPEGGDLRAYVSRSIAERGYPVRAVVVMMAPAEEVAARVPASVAVVERLDAERCRLATGAHSLRSLAAWLLMLGIDFEVVEPKELCDELRALRDRVDRVLGEGVAKPAVAEPSGDRG